MKKRRTKEKFNRLIRQLEGCILRLGSVTTEFSQLDGATGKDIEGLLNDIATFVNTIGEAIVEAKE